MRILMISNHLGVQSGVQRYVQNLLLHMDTARYQVDLFVGQCPPDQASTAPALQAAGVQILAVPDHKKDRIRALWAHLRTHKDYDIIHYHTASKIGAPVCGMMRALCPHAKIVVHSHIVYPPLTLTWRAAHLVYQCFADYFLGCGVAAGRFVFGGFEADTGLTGRKLMVDTYGGLAAHGGGAFSGKDPTKVDRSAAYMARAIARNVVGAWLAEECQVSISYAIGKAEPTAVEIDTFGTARVDEDVIRLAVLDVFDLRPAAIMSLLHLRAPIYADTAAYGHFNGYKFSWENLDKTEELRKAVKKYAD